MRYLTSINVDDTIWYFWRDTGFPWLAHSSECLTSSSASIQAFTPVFFDDHPTTPGMLSSHSRQFIGPADVEFFQYLKDFDLNPEYLDLVPLLYGGHLIGTSQVMEYLTSFVLCDMEKEVYTSFSGGISTTLDRVRTSNPIFFQSEVNKGYYLVCGRKLRVDMDRTGLVMRLHYVDSPSIQLILYCMLDLSAYTLKYVICLLDMVDGSLQELQEVLIREFLEDN